MKILTMVSCLLCATLLSGQYSIYDYPDGNLYAQQLLPLRDGNLLLIAEIDCYTPGAITIEGCHYALQLTKITMQGDTLWNSVFQFPGYSIRPFENIDGSFTFFSIEYSIGVCDNIGAWPIFPAVGITSVSTTGQKVSHVEFPDECELALTTVKQIGENQFALLATFSKWPYLNDQAEGRLMIVNNAGTILHETTEYGRNWDEGNIFFKGTDSLQLFYVDTAHHINLKTFDLFLQPGSHLSNTSFQNDCISGYNKISLDKTANDDFLVICSDRIADTSYQYISRFDATLQFEGEFITRFSNPSNFISLLNGDFLVAATIKNPFTGLDVQINQFDDSGAIHTSKTIAYGGDERPKHFVKMLNDSLLLTGSLNCCNYDDSIGAGKTFFLKEEMISTSIENPESGCYIQVYPNPVGDFLTVKLDIPEINDLIRLTIFDQLGHPLVKQNLLSPIQKIIVSNLNQGIYFYEISVGNEPIYTGKFVKLSH